MKPLAVLLHLSSTLTEEGTAQPPSTALSKTPARTLSHILGTDQKVPTTALLPPVCIMPSDSRRWRRGDLGTAEQPTPNPASQGQGQVSSHSPLSPGGESEGPGKAVL